MVGGWSLLSEKGLLGHTSEGAYQSLLVTGLVFGADFILSQKFHFRVLVSLLFLNFLLDREDQSILCT